MGGGDQFGGVGVDELRVLIEEAGEAFPGPARRGDEGAVGRVNRLLNLAPRTHGKHPGQQLAGTRIDRLKRLLSDRGTPLTIDQHGVRRHRFTFQATRMKEQGEGIPGRTSWNGPEKLANETGRSTWRGRREPARGVTSRSSEHSPFRVSSQSQQATRQTAAAGC